MSELSQDVSSPDESAAALLPRSVIGGVLMGLANLVPGISGGTMLLAVGVYPRFIQAIAEVTRLKPRKLSLVVLGVIVCAAGAAILLLAGPVKTLVVELRWVMYSIFIGLTLGGVPVVWQLMGAHSKKTWIGAIGGFLAMMVLALAQSTGTGGGSNEGLAIMFVAGVAGASAMILPGISGGYLFLVLGVYVPILGALATCKNALKAGDLMAVTDPVLQVVLPVGVGVVIGVVGVSNLLKMLLEKHKDATLGVLLGFLVGAVIGLWPFQHGVRPQVGDLYRGQSLTAAALETLDPSKYPTAFFSPSTLQVVGAIALIIAGFLLTALIARFGQQKR